MSAIIARQIAPADFIRFDAITQHDWNVPKTVTRHPVIPAPEISDHVQIQNGVLRFRGHIATPAGVIPSVTAARVRLFFDLIGGALCTVTTFAGVYTNCIVTATERETIGGMVVDVQAQQVRIATIAEVPIPPRTPNPEAAAQQASSQDAGAASAASSGSSLAASAADAAQGVADLLFGG